MMSSRVSSITRSDMGQQLMRKRDLSTRVICINGKSKAKKGIYHLSDSFFVYVQKSSDVSQRGH